MSTYIDLIAEELIRRKHKFILYGADADALIIMTTLKERYGIKPVCLCDNDKRNRYKTLSDVVIMPPDEAIAMFPDADIVIASGFHKYHIIGSLLSSGKVTAERILNFEPVEKRKSCIYLESYIICTGHKLNFCCSDFGKNKSPFVAFNGDYELSAKEFIIYRDKLIDDLNRGEPTPCDGCPGVKEDWYALDRKLMIVNNGEEGTCNFDCCYCKSLAKASRNVSNDINVANLLTIFGERNLLAEELHTIISCGEICVHPQRGDIYDSISTFRNTICTNASVCDKRILELLELGGTDLVVSVDAGTRDTFRKIKGHDLYDTVCENIRRYGGAGGVRLKYIFLPGINDNKADIDGFITLCRNAGTKLVQISYDLYAPPDLTAQTVSMARYLADKLSENGIIYRILSDVIDQNFYKYEE